LVNHKYHFFYID